MLLVKWQGQKESTWEPRSELEETAALDDFEKRYGTCDNVGDTNFEVIKIKRENKIKNQHKPN